MPKDHRWTDKTEEGEKRRVRAIKHGGNWRFQAKLDSQEEWTYFDRPSMEDLERLLKILQSKYHRKRAPYDDVVHIERWLRDERRRIQPKPVAHTMDSSGEE